MDRIVLMVFVALGALSSACHEQASTTGTARSEVTLVHLADRTPDAEAAAPPTTAREQRLWRFDQPQPEWHVFSSETVPWLSGVSLEQRADCLALSLSSDAFAVGGIALELDGGPVSDWSAVLVRARTHERLSGLAVACNLAGKGAVPGPFQFIGGEEGTAPVFSDGSEQVYSLPLRPRDEADELRSLGLFVGAPRPAGLEILSIALVPRGADFPGDHGVRSVTRDSVTRRTLFAHAPASLTWKLRVPAGGRLDFGLSSLPGESVAYRVTARGAGSPEVFEETVSDARTWRQCSLDLARFAGDEVSLTFEATSERAGAVPLWGAPILSGTSHPQRPNVILYVIDGGGADLMSLYGYERPTTPFLEQLAAEGVVFERAFSNATWTQASTASFMTSLQHSVLGGLRRGVHSTPVPAAAVTMAEHMRAGGYQTAVFTANPNAGRVIGLERGVDVMRDAETEQHSTSSTELQEWFWRFRQAYPGRPYWVHFQTTDVHEPNESVPPFAGTFVPAEQRAKMEGWEGRLFESAGELFGTMSVADFYDAALARAGVDRHEFYDTRRGLYDETMEHQDKELERFVERLKAAGEWPDTLLVIAADHGHPAGTFARFGRGLFEPQPERWQGALFDSYSTRVPLVFVWPGHIPSGRRIDQPVSMIDVLPTILELAGLPQPDVLQGRSLAPLLRGGELEPRPVIFDEFRVDETTGELIGNLDVVDGRWGASLEIGPSPAGSDALHGRHSVPAGGRWGAVHAFFPETPRLLLYDLEQDRFARSAVNDQHPELVEHYQRLLLERWEAHRALAQRFAEAGDVSLAPDQLQQLQALGYIR